MRIINIDKMSRKPKFKSRPLIFILAFCVLSLIPACVKEDALEEARTRAGRSAVYYQHAVQWYKSIIAKGADTATAHFELGRLYYSHGEFEKARDELKEIVSKQARKLLAISLYRLGNFSDALEIFSKDDFSDGESLYFYGLTCEKLNLFDKALDVYAGINSGEFSSLAKTRISAIEMREGRPNIKTQAPDTHKIIQSSPSQSDYPQAGALILRCDEEVEVTAQDTQISRMHYLVKILNERGKEDFSETHIEYDSTYEKVELEYARTIKPDGSVVDVGSRHIRDVSKYLNFPLYSNARVYIISFPEIAEGVSIEYEVRVYRNQLLTKKDFVMHYPLQSSEPIISAGFRLTLPKDKELRLKALNETYNTFNANLRPDIQKEDSRLAYTWDFKDIPQIIPEPSMPANVEINPAILMSSFKSWQDIYDWWWPLAKDKIKSDAEIQNKVKDLTRGLSAPEDKIRAIYNFCAKEIRYVAVEYGQAGYEPHKAQDIFKNKYGDCKDQAILLITMLKDAGFLAWPVLIPTKDCYDLRQDFPAVFFDHCIAAVSLNGEMIFLDPTAQTCSFRDLPSGDQGRNVLIIKEDRYEIGVTPFFAAKHNLLRQEIDIGISGDESITAKKNVFTRGIFDQAQRYWLLFTPPQLIEEKLKEGIQDVSIGAKLNKYEIKNADDLNSPVVLSYEFSGPEYLTLAGNLRVMPQLAGVDTGIVSKDKRRFPIEFSLLDQKETIIEFWIPVNFSVKYLPGSVIEDSPWLKFTAEYSRKGNRLIFRQVAESKKNIVSIDEYPAFKSFLDNLAKRVKERVILEKAR